MVDPFELEAPAYRYSSRGALIYRIKIVELALGCLQYWNQYQVHVPGRVSHDRPGALMVSVVAFGLVAACIL
jgi:hypothetical protein